MLSLEQQVCSLELAKKLKSLDVKQESLVSWQRFAWPEEHWELRHYLNLSKVSENDTPQECAAFTVGDFDGKGLGVHGRWDADRYDDLGLASARKLDTGALETPDCLNLETLSKRVENLEQIIKHHNLTV